MKKVINFGKNVLGFVFRFTAAAVVTLSIILNVVLIKEHIDNRNLKENTKSVNLFSHTISWSEKTEPEDNKVIDLLDELIEEVKYRLS